ncbi:hypothetical protein ACHAWF_006757 [Thalassiosira exigua]
MTRFQTTASNLLISALAASTSRVALVRSAGEPMGNAECPCLPSSYFRHHDRFQSHETIAAFETTLGKSVDPAKYGIGCRPHDEGTSQCSDAGGCSSLVPLPPDCDKSYCRRSWCFVDPDNCSLLNNPSELFDGGKHHYSYATCGELDLFTHTERLKSLKGKTFRVAYARNSGGWKGAYNPAGSFAVNEQWTGPIVDFVREAALEAGFVVKMTEPPPWLRPKSREFFGNGTFDSCVYAVSLGYLDFCVGGFSITGKRSSITAMFETTSDPLYLVVYADGGGETSWESFLKTTLTVFQPFTAAAWLMIFAFCLPVLGLLMLFHEYGAPGSAYPEEEALCVKGRRKQPAKVEIRRIPLIKHALDSLYMGTLSFFQGSYDQSVVTTGGKINLLAIASFVMLILAVYTANLAAILTNDASAVSVDSVEMAVRQGMNICAERKVARCSWTPTESTPQRSCQTRSISAVTVSPGSTAPPAKPGSASSRACGGPTPTRRDIATLPSPARRTLTSSTDMATTATRSGTGTPSRTARSVSQSTTTTPTRSCPSSTRRRRTAS